MPRITSPNWDEETGVCRVHNIASIPCPECMLTKHPDIEVKLTQTDKDCLALDPKIEGVEDLLPADWQDWLMERVQT